MLTVQYPMFSGFPEKSMFSTALRRRMVVLLTQEFILLKISLNSVESIHGRRLGHS